MQIVINIDDEDYDDITLTGENIINLGVLLDLREAVRNGTPLPKGHGRIGDLDALEEEMEGGIKAGLMIEGYEDYSHINDTEDCLECVKYADALIKAREN